MIYVILSSFEGTFKFLGKKMAQMVFFGHFSVF